MSNKAIQLTVMSRARCFHLDHLHGSCLQLIFRRHTQHSVSGDRDIFLKAVQAADVLPTDVRESAATVEGLERRVLDQTYCDFLREQIALEPRGPEWTAVLSKRLAAIAPFVGVTTLVGTIRAPGGFHYVRVDATTRRIIHCETHETNAPG